MPAGVKSTDESQVGTSTSLGRRACPLPSKKVRYFSRSSSVFMGADRSGRGAGAVAFVRTKYDTATANDRPAAPEPRYGGRGRIDGGCGMADGGYKIGDLRLVWGM